MRQKIICICGAHSGCGKTTVAENLLGLLGASWGAVKYTKTAFYTSVVHASADEAIEGKDTSRLSRAGAKDVVWLQSPVSDLQEALEIAINMLSGCVGIVVEGNSPIEFLTPDIVIFVFGKDANRVKSSALRALEKADIVIYQDGVPDSAPLHFYHGKPVKGEVVCIDFKKRENFHKLRERVMEKIQGEGTNNLRERLLRHVRDKGIPCSVARKIAEEEGIAYNEVGRIADELNIKIVKCELGCF